MSEEKKTNESRPTPADQGAAGQPTGPALPTGQDLENLTPEQREAVEELKRDARKVEEYIKFAEMRGADIQVQLPVRSALNIIAQLQVALCHPNNTGPSAFEAWKLKETLTVFLNNLAPGIGEVIRNNDRGPVADYMQAQEQAQASGPRIIRPS